MFGKNKGKGVIVNVHGYSQNVPQGYRPWEAVTYDRLNKSLELADFFERHGINANIVISGGTLKDDVAESDAMYQWAKNNMPAIKRFEVQTETQSANTSQNIINVKKIAADVGADAIFSVSSKDHVSRIVRDFAYSDEGKGMLFGGVPTQEPYSMKGYFKQPFIAEPPFWGYGAIEDIFKVPKEKTDYVARTIERFIAENIKQ